MISPRHLTIILSLSDFETLFSAASGCHFKSVLTGLIWNPSEFFSVQFSVQEEVSGVLNAYPKYYYPNIHQHQYLGSTEVNSDSWVIIKWRCLITKTTDISSTTPTVWLHISGKKTLVFIYTHHSPLSMWHHICNQLTGNETQLSNSWHGHLQLLRVRSWFFQHTLLGSMICCNVCTCVSMCTCECVCGVCLRLPRKQNHK